MVGYLRKVIKGTDVYFKRGIKSTSKAGKTLLDSGLSRKEAAAELRNLRKTHSPQISSLPANDPGRAGAIKHSRNKINEDAKKIANNRSSGRKAPNTENETDISNDWLDDGYNAETELDGIRKGYKEGETPKASSRDMGATDEDLAAGGDKAAKGRVMRRERQARRKAAREEANKGGSGESGKAWYDDEESRAFAQSQADEEYQQLKVDWNNKSADLNEKIAKAKESGDVKAIQKLQDEKREAYLGYRKKREDFYEKDSKGNLVYHKDKNGRDVIGRKQVDPNMLDWVRGHGYDKAAAGIGALGFAGSVAFGGAKSNADLYSNPF